MKVKCQWCKKEFDDIKDDVGLCKTGIWIWICRDCYNKKKYRPHYRVDSFQF